MAQIDPATSQYWRHMSAQIACMSYPTSQNGPIVLRKDSNIRNMDALDGLSCMSILEGLALRTGRTHANIKNLNSLDRPSMFWKRMGDEIWHGSNCACIFWDQMAVKFSIAQIMYAYFETRWLWNLTWLKSCMHVLREDEWKKLAGLKICTHILR